MLQNVRHNSCEEGRLSEALQQSVDSDHEASVVEHFAEWLEELHEHDVYVGQGACDLHYIAARDSILIVPCVFERVDRHKRLLHLADFCAKSVALDAVGLVRKFVSVKAKQVACAEVVPLRLVRVKDLYVAVDGCLDRRQE